MIYCPNSPWIPLSRVRFNTLVILLPLWDFYFSSSVFLVFFLHIVFSINHFDASYFLFHSFLQLGYWKASSQLYQFYSFLLIIPVLSTYTGVIFRDIHLHIHLSSLITRKPWMDLAAQPPSDLFCSVLLVLTKKLSLSYVCKAFAVPWGCGYKHWHSVTIQNKQQVSSSWARKDLSRSVDHPGDSPTVAKGREEIKGAKRGEHASPRYPLGLQLFAAWELLQSEIYLLSTLRGFFLH